MSPPEVLYHGSLKLVPVLEARENLLFGAHDRQAAIPFTLAIRPDDRGRCTWSLHKHATDPRITIEHGWLDTTGVGYLYHLPADRFEHRQHQSVSYEAVTPLSHEVIRSADYVGWISSGEIR
jgi:hypothetical protein